MDSRRILLTGLSTYWGGRLAQALESFPEGIRSQAARKKDIKALKGDVNYKPHRTHKPTVFAPEPKYTVEA